MRSLPMTFCSSLMTTAWLLSSFSRSCCWPRNLFRHCFHTCTTVTVTALCHLLGDRGRITKQPSQQLSAFCFTYSSNHYSNHLQWLVRCNSHFNQSHTHARTHTHTFNGPLSGTTRVGPYQKGNKKFSYRRGTARYVVSIEILPIATQQCRNYLYDKSWPNRWYEVGDLVGGNAW